MKLLKQYFAVLCVAFSTVAVANVSGDMFQMNREVNQLLKADSVEAFQQSADKFLTAAKKAQETMPKSLDGDQTRFAGYQKGMQEVIDVVTEAKSLAEQGKLEEAKTTATKLNQLKKTYHAEYK
ncbi:cytochrome b562 [Glaesserella sp.]|uniref:cytochrome b562 n=1 Tax=Glaesserella sp. TaxID=2094731 RepID=UPI0035A0DB5C